MIYQAVKAVVGDSMAVVHVDADEAAVLGAGLYGASLSPQFKTKGIDVSDISMYDVMVSYPVKPREVSLKTFTTIFPPGSKIGSKKTLTFKNEKDFSMELLYRKIPFVYVLMIWCCPPSVDRIVPFSDHPRVIFEAKIGGVPEAIANLTENGVTDPVVETTVTLTESGFVFITDASAVGKVKRETNGEEWALTTLFTSTGTDSESAVLADDTNPSESSFKVTVPLTVDFEFGSTRPMTPIEKRLARHR